MKGLSVMFISLLAAASVAHANSYKCNGADNNDNKVNLIFNGAAKTISINSNSYKIIAPTNDRHGVATEDFMKNGKKVYAALEVDGKDVYGKDRVFLYQFDSATNQFLNRWQVACED